MGESSVHNGADVFAHKLTGDDFGVIFAEEFDVENANGDFVAAFCCCAIWDIVSIIGGSKNLNVGVGVLKALDNFWLEMITVRVRDDDAVKVGDGWYFVFVFYRVEN